MYVKSNRIYQKPCHAHHAKPQNLDAGQLVMVQNLHSGGIWIPRAITQQNSHFHYLIWSMFKIGTNEDGTLIISSQEKKDFYRELKKTMLKMLCFRSHLRRIPKCQQLPMQLWVTCRIHCHHRCFTYLETINCHIVFNWQFHIFVWFPCLLGKKTKMYSMDGSLIVYNCTWSVILCIGVLLVYQNPSCTINHILSLLDNFSLVTCMWGPVITAISQFCLSLSEWWNNPALLIVWMSPLIQCNTQTTWQYLHSFMM